MWILRLFATQRWASMINEIGATPKRCLPGGYSRLFILTLVLSLMTPLPVLSKDRYAYGRKLKSPFGRMVQASCNACPSHATAVSSCSSLPPSIQSSTRNTIIAACGSSGAYGGSCCTAMKTNWDRYLNCLCAGGDVLEGLDAFVDLSAVIEVCGCGDVSTTTASSTAVATSSATVVSGSSSGDTSSNVAPDIQAILDAQP